MLRKWKRKIRIMYRCWRYGHRTEYVMGNPNDVKEICIRCEKEVQQLKRSQQVNERPPRGLTPRHIWEEQRQEEIMAAVERYKQAGKHIPPEWVAEYRVLDERLKARER